MAREENQPSGAGGKFRKAPFRRSTPYDRLPWAAAEKGGWISKLVDPAQRLAHRFFNTFFNKRLPSSSDANHEAGNIDQEEVRMVGKSSQDTLKVDNRRCLRRQFEAEKLELTEDLFEIKDDNKRRLRRQLASSKAEELPTGDLLDTIDDNKRCLRRQSERFKTENPEVTKGPEVTAVQEAITEPDVPKDSFEITDNKRLSARFKTEEPELTKGQEVTEELKVIHLSGSTCSSLSKEDGGNAAVRSRRLSIRPKRQAAEKINSYKETPLNTKMRRD